MASIRLAVPESASAGEVIELKALIRHPMESGYRRGARGEVITRDIITRFECRYVDEIVFAADFHPGVAANPILTFYLRAERSDDLVFRWIDQHGKSWTETARLEVS